MSDLFNNSTIGTATQWGVFSFPNTYPSGPSSSYFWKTDSVGVEVQGAQDGGDYVDFFTFYAYNLVSLKVGFTASRTSNYANVLNVIPVEGVKAVSGDIAATWYGGEHNSSDSPFNMLTTSSVNTTLQNKQLFLPGIDANQVTVGFDEFPDSEAEWTIDNSLADENGLVKVTFQVTGFEYDGTSDQIIANGGFPEEVSYRIDVSPSVGLPNSGDGSGGSGGSGGGSDGSGSSRTHQTTSGNDTVFGTVGVLDVVILPSNGGGTTYRIDGDTVYVNGTSLGSDTLHNVERLQYLDGTLAIDTGAGENAGVAYRIYQAAFARTPDNGGLKFWIEQVDNGSSLYNVARSFIASDEFRSVYGENVTNTNFVAKMYQNVLGREGEAGGMNYWVGQLNSGSQDKAQVLAGFSESTENIAGVAPAIDSGIWLT